MNRKIHIYIDISVSSVHTLDLSDFEQCECDLYYSL